MPYVKDDGHMQTIRPLVFVPSARSYSSSHQQLMRLQAGPSMSIPLDIKSIQHRDTLVSSYNPNDRKGSTCSFTNAWFAESSHCLKGVPAIELWMHFGGAKLEQYRLCQVVKEWARDHLKAHRTLLDTK